MIYFLEFHPKALKEWKNLEQTLKLHFQKKIKERLTNPRVEKDKLSGYQSMYKIKLRSAGYRLVYEVKDEAILVYVLSVAKRENNEVYKNLKDRI
jgi:mRNA interferase RelE/StbE